ncbi:MAG: hypothetical protein ACRD2S_12040 [Terriglobales bacterium]
MAIAASAGALLLLIFFGYLLHLNNQGPVLSRSEESDPLSGVPNSISLNPLRNRASEHVAAKYLRTMRDGNCQSQLADMEKDYRRKYANFICESEAEHPLTSWTLVDWEDQPPLRILQYRARRFNDSSRKGTYEELLSVTMDNSAGAWVVTKYDAMY